MSWTFGPPLIDGLGHRSIPSVMSTQMETGDPRNKRYATRDQHEVRGSFHLADKAARAAFWAFWDGEANHGADWFDMDISTLENLVTHQVKIRDPEIARNGQGYTLTLTIRVRQRLNA